MQVVHLKTTKIEENLLLLPGLPRENRFQTVAYERKYFETL